MNFKIFFIYMCLFASTSLADTIKADTDLILGTPLGQIKGTEKRSYAGNSYYAFYSIRYAKPPTGELRFQAPVAVEPWKDIYDATWEKNYCYQVNVDSQYENEDCLTLNVYIPKSPFEIATRFPVLVYIHGGGFNWGSGQTRDSTGGIYPQYFMDTGGFIMVSINYRLGPFGFLSTGDSVIPGNAGLKDQVMSLKWVQQNIVSFGGDPSQVTIFGESAGAASVGYLLLSPSAKGLFSAAILSSGTALCPWAYQRNQTEITFKTASFLNSQFETDRNSNNLLNYLQNVDAKALDHASFTYMNWAQSYNKTDFNSVINGQLEQGFFFAPVVEADHPDAFLTKSPYEAFASGDFHKVPILIGTCADEGLMKVNKYLQWTMSVYDQNYAWLVPQGMKISDLATRTLVGNAIKQEYSPSSKMQNNLVSGLNYWTDQDFQKSLIKHAELQSKYTDVYFYKFTYSGKLGGNTNQTYPGTSNVTHCEEGNYLFQRYYVVNFPYEDAVVHDRLVKLWFNFITKKNPTPSEDTDLQKVIWPKFQNGSRQYLDIGKSLYVETNPKKTYDFWDNLFNTYGVRPWETF